MHCTAPRVAAGKVLARLQANLKHVQYVSSNIVMLRLGLVAADTAQIDYAVALHLQQTLLSVILMGVFTAFNFTVISLPPPTNLLACRASHNCVLATLLSCDPAIIGVIQGANLYCHRAGYQATLQVTIVLNRQVLLTLLCKYP